MKNEKPVGGSSSVEATALNTTSAPLSRRLRDGTLRWHRRAERTGFIREMIHGLSTRATYTLYVRSLLHVYDILEDALEKNRLEPAVRLVAWPSLYRHTSLQHDFGILVGAGSSGSIPLLPAAALYAARIEKLGRERPDLLVSHAYTRYLGDLNGGRVLERILRERLGIEYEALSFFRYEAVIDASSTARAYRDAIDVAGHTAIDHAAAVHEARIAFRLNIYLSSAVARASTECLTP